MTRDNRINLLSVVWVFATLIVCGCSHTSRFTDIETTTPAEPSQYTGCGIRKMAVCSDGMDE